MYALQSHSNNIPVSLFPMVGQKLERVLIFVFKNPWTFEKTLMICISMREDSTERTPLLPEETSA